ncbi:MAG: dephospho-CoA kinase, partial [Chloroflexi bacterium]|nr:dephospho-CoA kinase [Chloroflexota bacterium]
MSEQATPTRFSGKLIIGLTGNIATGKSAVMDLAAEQGALTIDTDKIVHELLDNDAKMQAAIAVAFGSEVRLEDGRIDRRALGEIVFNDPRALRDLESMTHPIVGREVAKQIDVGEPDVVFIEAIKLLEGALAKICHQIWVTRCSRQRQLDRLRICRGMDTETAVARIKAQPS